MKALGRLIKSCDGNWTMTNSLILQPKFHQLLDTWCCQIHGPDLFEEDTYIMADRPERAIDPEDRSAGRVFVRAAPDFHGQLASLVL